MDKFDKWQKALNSSWWMLLWLNYHFDCFCLKQVELFVFRVNPQQILPQVFCIYKLQTIAKYDENNFIDVFQQNFIMLFTCRCTMGFVAFTGFQLNLIQFRGKIFIDSWNLLPAEHQLIKQSSIAKSQTNKIHSKTHKIFPCVQNNLSIYMDIHRE